jgi:hypothetical protein
MNSPWIPNELPKWWTFWIEEGKVTKWRALPIFSYVHFHTYTFYLVLCKIACKQHKLQRKVDPNIHVHFHTYAFFAIFFSWNIAFLQTELRNKRIVNFQIATGKSIRKVTHHQDLSAQEIAASFTLKKGTRQSLHQ